MKRVSIPEKCVGCERATDIAAREIPSEKERVEKATGLKVWAAESYSSERVSTFYGYFDERLDHMAAEEAAAGYDQEVLEANQELEALTESCPGLQTERFCGRVTLEQSNKH